MDYGSSMYESHGSAGAAIPAPCPHYQRRRVEKRGLLQKTGRVFSAVCLTLLFWSTPFPGYAATQAPFSFYAVYQRVATLASLNLSKIHQSLMSRDGRLLYIYGEDRANRKLALYRMGIDGSHVKAIPLPQALNGIHEGTVSGDGSRLFLRNHWERSIWKVEGGSVRKIFDADDYKEVGSCDQIQTTGDGEWVYFRDPSRAVWRIREDGGPPRRVVRESEIQRDSGRSAHINRFSISEDGSTMALVVSGFFDSRNVYHEKNEVFTWQRGSIRQLTNDPKNIFKVRVAISGDGRTIAFTRDLPDPRMYVVRNDGSAGRALDPIAQVGRVVLSHDGSVLFYYDVKGNGGRMVRTDGSGGLDLFPAYNVGAIALHAVWSLAADKTGERISFRFNDGLYVGNLGGPGTVPHAPVIREILLEPPVTDAEAAGKACTLRARITDPDGLQDIVRLSTNVLMAGHTVRGNQGVPLYFYHPVSDKGQPPDQTAGDGIFTSVGEPGGDPGALAGFGVRVGVMDRHGNVVVADAGPAGAALGISTPVPGQASPSPGEARRLSADQRHLVESLGWPDAFWLTFDRDPDGKERVVTLEGWTYYEYLTRFEFVDGRLVAGVTSDEPIDPSVGARRYRPPAFGQGMTLKQVQGILPETDLFRVDLPEAYGEGLVVYMGEQIILGFEKDRLQYVETTPLAPAVEKEGTP